MIEFKIPLKVTGEWGLNKKYSGEHWSVRDREAEQVHMLVKSCLRSARIPRGVFEKPVAITIFYNSHLDIDNHGYLSKLIIDGLKSYVIADDNRKHVKSLTQEFYDEDGITVRIEEINV